MSPNVTPSSGGSRSQSPVLLPLAHPSSSGSRTLPRRVRSIVCAAQRTSCPSGPCCPAPKSFPADRQRLLALVVSIDPRVNTHTPLLPVEHQRQSTLPMSAGYPRQALAYSDASARSETRLARTPASTHAPACSHQAPLASARHVSHHSSQPSPWVAMLICSSAPALHSSRFPCSRCWYQRYDHVARHTAPTPAA